MNPLDTQVSGNHYKTKAIQPVEYIHANKLGYFEGNVIKYVTRWKDKGGISDLQKAKHYIELLIQLEESNNNDGGKIEAHARQRRENRQAIWEQYREDFGHRPTKEEVPEEYYYCTTIGG